MLHDLWRLFSVFFKIGSVTFGGGYAMLPILRRELVQSLHWFDEEEIMDYYALSQGLPGIIAINVAAFVGHKRCGVSGAIAAALGIVSPCIIIISTIAAFLSNVQDNIYIKRALSGISVCVTALIADAVISLWKKGVKDSFGIVLCIVMLILSVFTELSPILLVVSCALLGIGVKSFKDREGKKG